MCVLIVLLFVSLTLFICSYLKNIHFLKISSPVFCSGRAWARALAQGRGPGENTQTTHQEKHAHTHKNNHNSNKQTNEQTNERTNKHTQQKTTKQTNKQQQKRWPGRVHVSATKNTIMVGFRKLPRTDPGGAHMRPSCRASIKDKLIVCESLTTGQNMRKAFKQTKQQPPPQPHPHPSLLSP